MISFNPTLNETTILNIPFHPGHLTFTATVTPDDELQLDSRSIIQIWADIPDNNQPLGLIKGEQQEWSARSFEFQNNSSTAYLPIPFQSFLHDPYRSHFSFTYRILHPDGRVQWLGEYGKNGSLIVNRYDDRLVLFGDWAANPLGHSFTPKSTIKSPLQVLALSDKIQWRCWDLSNGCGHSPIFIFHQSLPSCPQRAKVIIRQRWSHQHSLRSPRADPVKIDARPTLTHLTFL